MNTLIFPDRRSLKLHTTPAISTFTFFLILTTFIIYDRRPPFDYINTDITPQYVSQGGTITINRNVIWYRKCEGEAWTEIVSSDRIVTPYDKGYRYPAETGITFAQRNIELPLVMRKGAAYYRGSIRFHNCGLTSWLKPLKISYQQRSFEVK